MGLDQLMGRYSRLRQELAVAYRERPWHGARIDRLADDLAETERAIASSQPTDEHHDNASRDAAAPQAESTSLRPQSPA